MKSIGAVLDDSRGLGKGFDFLRLALALGVASYHIIQISTGTKEFHGPADVLVYGILIMFFGLSGFLIAGSAQRLTLKNFLINRGLRIFPALYATRLWPLSSVTRYRESGSTSATTPFIWMTSSFANGILSVMEKPGGCRAFCSGRLARQSPRRPVRSVDRANVRRLLPLRARRDVEGDPLAFLQRLEALSLDCGKMGKEILAAVLGRDEPEALGIVEPLHGTCCHCLDCPEKK